MSKTCHQHVFERQAPKALPPLWSLSVDLPDMKSIFSYWKSILSIVKLGIYVIINIDIESSAWNDTQVFQMLIYFVTVCIIEED